VTGVAAPTIALPRDLDPPKYLQRLLVRDLPDGSQIQFEYAPVGWPTKSKPDQLRKAEWRRYYHHNHDARTELTSVTTILDVLAKQALYAWHEDHGARGAVEAARLGELPDDLPLDEVVGRVRALGLGAQAAKMRAAKRGLDVHDALEVWAKTSSLPDPATMDPEHRPYLRGLARALLKLDPAPVACEQLVCSTEHRFAGRYDMRATVAGADCLLDLKTNAAGRGWPEAHVQLPAYALAELECGGTMPERLLVVGVGPDGAFNVDECCGSPDDFLAVLAAFRSMGRVRNGVDALKRLSAAQRTAAT
jgi:hypothetical protein